MELFTIVVTFFIVIFGLNEFVLKIRLVYIAAFVLGIVTIFLLRSIVQYSKERKNKIILEKALKGIAKDYYKDIYGKDVELFGVELFFDQDLFVKTYRPSGVVYVDDRKSTWIKITLNIDFSLRNIRDNVPINETTNLENMLKTVLKKFGIQC